MQDLERVQKLYHQQDIRNMSSDMLGEKTTEEPDYKDGIIQVIALFVAIGL